MVYSSFAKITWYLPLGVLGEVSVQKGASFEFQHSLTNPSDVSPFNCKFSRKDNTKTGHAFGEAVSRPTIAEPQRNLSPILCSLLRIIMHSAMVVGACRNPQVMRFLTVNIEGPVLPTVDSKP